MTYMSTWAYLIFPSNSVLVYQYWTLVSGDQTKYLPEYNFQYFCVRPITQYIFSYKDKKKQLVRFLMAYQSLRVIQSQSHPWRKTEVILCWRDKRVYTFSKSIGSKVKCNSVTGVWTHLLWGHSPAHKPLHHGDFSPKYRNGREDRKKDMK